MVSNLLFAYEQKRDGALLCKVIKRSYTLSGSKAPGCTVNCTLLPCADVDAAQFHVFLAAKIFKARRGRAANREPSASSPYNRSLEMRPGSILLTFPSQRRHLSLRKAKMLLMLARSKTCVFGTLFCISFCISES